MSSCKHSNLDFKDQFMPAWIILDTNAREVRMHFMLVRCDFCEEDLVDSFLVGLTTWERYEIGHARL